MKGRDLALPAIALAVLIADQASKAWVTKNIPLNTIREVNPQIGQWFVLTHITNSGAAFGLFPQLGLVFTFVALAVSIVIVAYYRSIPAGRWLVRISLGLQLGGAIGNLIDRLRFGYVIDMLYLRFWPVFNLADSAIVLGVALLMWHLVRTSPQKTSAAVMLPGDPTEKIESPGDGA